MSNSINHTEKDAGAVLRSPRSAGLLAGVGYFVIWVAAVLSFWLFTPSDAMGYSLLVLWIILPAATFAGSLILGAKNCWGHLKWLAVPVSGVMYMLAEYATFSAANTAAFGKVLPPQWGMIAVGALISAAGLGAGALIWLAVTRRRQRRGAGAENSDESD